MFSVVNSLVRSTLSQFSSCSFAFGGVCSRFMLLYCSQSRYIIWYNFILLPVFNKYFPALGWLLLYLYSDVFIYRPQLSTQIGKQNAFGCNALCCDSTCTYPLCSSFLHVVLFWLGLQPVCFAARFLEQAQHLIQLSFCCLFSTSTFLPCAGSCWIYSVMCAFINHGCQHTFAHNGFCCNGFCSDSTCPIHFVAVFFMLFCLGRVCNRFMLLHYSCNRYIIWYSFYPWSVFLFLRVLLLPVVCFFSLLELVLGGDWDQKVFHPAKMRLGDWPWPVILHGD